MDTDTMALLDELAQAEARESFWAYRQYMRPTMLKGWWQRQVAWELQRFYEDLIAGKRPYLLLEAPPQHGKSWQVTDFISWMAGKNPDSKCIYASYSDDLGKRANTQLQRLFDTQKFAQTFPETHISQANASAPGQTRNSEFLEYLGREGSFRNTTILGQITGQGLDLGVVDDPLKGRKEASSKPNRDNIWNWFTDDFFTRFSDKAGMIMMLTRWHLDDPAGRFIEAFPETRVCAYPAIATKDERFRCEGEALFPEHKSLEFLQQRKKGMTKGSWESLYQQNPIVVGGGLFPIEKFEILPVAPNKKDVRKSVRYWDKAGTEDGGAYTCGVLLHDMKDGTTVISDVRRGQWSALERETRMKQTAEIDRGVWGLVEVWVEQEPGSGGLESAERTIRNLRGFVVKKDKVTGSKEYRAEPYAAQVQGGNVYLVAGAWNDDFMDEHEEFPASKFKDQVDAAAGAFMKSTGKAYGSYDATQGWVMGADKTATGTERRDRI